MGGLHVYVIGAGITRVLVGQVLEEVGVKACPGPFSLVGVCICTRST